ncbi:putative K(+)/H(+) antiporter subunit E (plasmid) [Rhodovastum atsumiense]|uniref:Na+/H+ antiporter subunit E n=1 Tax=Rhodovastum atsumiense TaxID=504468 RepID=UPI002025799D|nr:Na+/H+ antiporter subunit E [Rhodovastum atsumiense]CAH2605480.1 putative K(+)/H(+) antiporter subunit E [Rhodovastum atsumiense]
MTRRLRFPVLMPALLAIWLLLTASLSAGNVLLGALLALVISATATVLTLPQGRLRLLGRTVPRLLWTVLVEVVRSNTAVARIILRLGSPRHRRSGFVRIPLDMRNPYGLATLACIITATPGTLWVDYDDSEGTMLLHVLDLIDEDAWVRIIKDKWERPLMEIFT